MRLKKACKRELNEPEYWRGVSNINKPSLLEFLKYRKEKIQNCLERENEFLRYQQDLSVLKSYYGDDCYNAKTIKHAENNIMNEETSSQINDFWTKQDIIVNHDNDEDDGKEEMAFVVNIFQEECAASAVDEKLARIFKSLNMGPIMDLRSYSRFSLSIDTNLHQQILHQIFDPIDAFITDDLHTFLVDFFNVDRGPEGWDNAVEELTIDDNESQIIKNSKKLLKRTLIQFFKAFSLNALNPLRDLTTLEKPHLNQFVHPIVDSALWIFGKINYIYGEIPLQGQIRADGIGYINDVTNYPLICGEGARPGASTQKHTNDDIKNVASMVRLYNNIIISEANSLNQLYINLRTYGLRAYNTEVSFAMLDFRGFYRLFEVDRFFLPKDWSEMPKFVYVYEAVIKWVLCVCSTKKD